MKTLKQQLQENVTHNACGLWCEGDIKRAIKEWLEQKRQEIDDNLPNMSVTECVEHQKAITKLLEELKE